MGVLRTVALTVLSISFFTFVAFFGRLPVFRNTPIGWLYRFIWVTFPKGVRWLDQSLTGGRLSVRLTRTAHHLMNDQHPVVLIFFLGLVTASAGLIIPQIWLDLSFKHHVFIPLLLPLPYLFSYLCTTSTTQTITPANHSSQVIVYPFDHILFHPGQSCRTCHFEKPARSKHCSICKSCIARADHHCIWVNACLGRGNYKHFLLLLFFSTVVVAYGALLAYIYLAPRVANHYLMYEAYHRQQQTVNISPDVPRIFAWIVQRLAIIGDWCVTALDLGGITVAGVGLLAFMTWPLPLGLLGYHIYLVYAGMTTNESTKWADWRDDMYDGAVFLTRILPNADTTDAARFSSWPVRSKQMLVRTNDGMPPRQLPPVIHEIVGDEVEWERCWKLAQVENLYDLGFWDNLMHVFAD